MNYKIIIILCLFLLGCTNSSSSRREVSSFSSEIDNIKNEYVNSIVVYNIPLKLEIRKINTVEVLMLKERYIKSFMNDIKLSKVNICNHFGYDTLGCEVKIFSQEYLNKKNTSVVNRPINIPNDPKEIDSLKIDIDTPLVDKTIVDTNKVHTLPDPDSDTLPDPIKIPPINNEPINENKNIVDAIEINLTTDLDFYDVKITRITPHSDNIQVLSEVKESKWIWKILPQKKGILDFQVIVDANRYFNDGRPEIIHNLDTYEKTVVVKSNFHKEFLFFIKRQKWLILTIIFCVFATYLIKSKKYIFLLKSYKNRDNTILQIQPKKDFETNKKYLVEATNRIKEGNIEDTLDILTDNIPKNKKDIEKILILFSSKYAILKKETLSGVLDEDVKNQRYMQLINGIIEVISQLKEDT